MKTLIKNEFEGWNFLEVFWLILATGIIIGLSIFWGDTPIAIISASTGVICVVATGKGKLSCYLFGIINIILYAIISYKAKYYGETMLNVLFYLPMQFVGFTIWKKHINEKSKEVLKQMLPLKHFGLLFIIASIIIFIYGFLLKKLGGNLPYVDSASTVLSIFAMTLSVKRYAEQWIMWIVINILSVIMWSVNFFNGNNDIATLIMWSIYLINSIIMFAKWYKESKINELHNKYHIVGEYAEIEYKNHLKAILK